MLEHFVVQTTTDLQVSMTHVGQPPQGEINGNLIALNALAGIPMSEIKGFRAPYLDYSADTLRMLAAAEFLYDSSASSSIPVTDPGTDAYWPYTLDYGMANDCLTVNETCKGQLKLPGFWEIPMYAYFDKRGVAGPHLMDPWLYVLHIRSSWLPLTKSIFSATPPMALRPSTTVPRWSTCRALSMTIITINGMSLVYA
jgi:hypothetical protein